MLRESTQVDAGPAESCFLRSSSTLTSPDLPSTKMAQSSTGRQAAASHLPPELLVHILSYIPHERATIQFRKKSEPRTFKSHLAFSHVCRAWRAVALISEYWPGIRLPLRDAKRMKEGITHGNGDTLFYVHIDMDRLDFPKHTMDEREKSLTVTALSQLSRIRTLFLKVDPDDDYMAYHEGYDDESDAWEYAHALGKLPAPELQDLTLGWLGNEHIELDFITRPFPRLRYLALMGCNTWRHQTLYQTDNLVYAKFWDVQMFLSIDELVDTFSRWKRLQHVSISNCNLIGGSRSHTKYKHRATNLPALEEIDFWGEAEDIGTFLTFIAFPPSARTSISFRGLLRIEPDTKQTLKDAVRDHLDTLQGRALLSDAHSFVIAYPDGFEIQPFAPKTSAPFFWFADDRPEAHFSFKGYQSQAEFSKEILTHLPALESVSRLDLSQSDCARLGPPPVHILQRFHAATELVINFSWLPLLDAITNDTALFPNIARLELFNYDLHAADKTKTLRDMLANVRNARSSLSRLVLRECKLADEMFENIFGEGNVRIESRRNR